jgi:hypothetical protein
MTSAPQNLTIYPDYCHALSATIGKWVPLRATDIHALEKVGMFCDGELSFDSRYFIRVGAKCSFEEQKDHYITTQTTP